MDKERIDHKRRVLSRSILKRKLRAEIIRQQIVRAFEIIDNIKLEKGFDDTAFREKFVNAKRSLESAYDDFLLSPVYLEEEEKKINTMTEEEIAQVI